MDRVMLSLSLKNDDDAPFNLPDLPQFYATERNACSLIGRMLNPEFQTMSALIPTMPNGKRSTKSDDSLSPRNDYSSSSCMHMISRKCSIKTCIHLVIRVSQLKNGLKSRRQDIFNQCQSGFGSVTYQ